MRFPFFTIFFLLSWAFYSQHYILEGQIIDASTKQPVSGAEIFIPEENKAAVSDLKGFFKFKLTQRKITVQVKSFGYETYSRKVTFNQNRLFITVPLKEQVFKLQEVIVSVPFGKLQQDNVMKIETRKTSYLEKKGLVSLSNQLAEMPGVRLFNSGMLAKPVIRGLSGNRILVYADNMRFDNFQFGAKHGLGLSTDGIENIEVIKGPASLIYGSDALGGIIYLVPEKFLPAYQHKAQIKLTAGSDNLFKLGLAWKQSFKKFKYLIRYSSQKRGDYHIPGQDFVNNSKFNTEDIKTALGYRAGKHRLDLRYHQSNSQTGLYKGISHSPSENFSEPYQKLRLQSVSLSDNIKSNGNRFDIKTGIFQYNRALIKGNKAFIGMILQTVSFNLKWKREFRSATLISGIDLQDKNIHNYGQHFLLPEAKEQTAAGFLSLQKDWDNDWSFQTGLRWDGIKIQTATDNEHPYALNKWLQNLNGAIGLKKNFRDEIFIRLNLAKGFRAPNLAEFTSNGLHAGRIEQGNPALKSEENFQADFNFEWKKNTF